MRWLVWVGTLCLAAACGRVNFDPQPDSGTVSDSSLQDATSDAAVDADASTDADADSGLPPLDLPFVEQGPLTELGIEEASAPTVSSDGLELYFVRSGQIHRSQRASTEVPWGAPSAVSELDVGGEEEEDPSLCHDDLCIFITVDGDIYRSDRTSKAAPWSTPVVDTELSAGGVVRSYGMASDGLSFFLLRRGDVLEASRRATDVLWGEPQEDIELSMGATCYGGWIDPNATLVLFSRRMAGVLRERVFYATRSDRESPFGTPVEVSGINRSENTMQPWLSQDLRTLFFERDNTIHFATR